VIRFDYGSLVPWVTYHGDQLHAIAGPDSVVVHSGVPLNPANFRHRATFTVAAGQTIAFKDIAAYCKPDNKVSLATTRTASSLGELDNLRLDPYHAPMGTAGSG
jgi:hypothetical protein